MQGALGGGGEPAKGTVFCPDLVLSEGALFPPPPGYANYFNPKLCIKLDLNQAHFPHPFTPHS